MKENGPPLGVCVLPEWPNNAARTVAYPNYVHEILQHAGLYYASIVPEQLASALPHLRVLVTVGQADLPDPLREALAAWVHDGGAWIGIAGVCGLEDLFGVKADAPTFSVWGGGGFSSLGEGYLAPVSTSAPVPDCARLPLHHFGGIAVTATTGKVQAKALDPHQRPTGRAALVEQENGKGVCLLIAPDLVGAVVRTQQGVAITRDGVPAPDGTGPVNDNVLKSDDGVVLDWWLDREPVPGVPGFSAFQQPMADQWREVLLRAIFQFAVRQRATLPLLWFYPRNLPALGHLSHDTDGNVVAEGEVLLDTLAKADAPGTWLVIAPGYPKEFVAKIRDAGHEVGFHYDAMSDGTVWGEADFDAQWRAIVDLFGGERPVSNKNHYLRWEGDTEFYEWCERHGIEFDESKGASKTGEAGYLFGTCHTFFPVDPKGRPLDVLELTTPTQDLLVFAPTQIAEPILDAAARYYGVAHFLFHPAHQPKDGVPQALLDVVARGKGLGMEWWTARSINGWERARRALVWDGYSEGHAGASVRAAAGKTLEEASVLWLAPEGGRVVCNGVEVTSASVERWGFRFQAATLDLEAGKEYDLAFGR